MWNRMKKWLHHILQEDPSNEDELSDSSQSDGGKKLNNEFQTKMVYQYPKQGEFRFPVIPDDKKGKKRTRSTEARSKQDENVTGYQSSNQSTFHTYTSQERRETPKQTYHASYSEHNQKHEHSQKAEEDMPYPFVPSDVPSPIYGFGNRAEQEEDKISLDDLPAFLRKQNSNSSVEDNSNKSMEENNEEMSDDESPIHEHRDEHSDPIAEDSSDNIVPFTRLQESEVTPVDESYAGSEAPETYETQEEEPEERKSFFMDFGEEDSASQTTDSRESEGAIEEEPISTFEEENSVEETFEEDMMIEKESEPEIEKEASKEETEPEVRDVEDSENEFASDVTEEENTEENAVSEEVEHKEDIEPVLDNMEEVIPGENDYHEADPMSSEEVQEETVQETQPELEPEQQSVPETTRERSRRPFNVIMTPRDKRNRDLKAKQEPMNEKVKQQEESVQKETKDEETEVASPVVGETAASEVEEVPFEEEVKDSTPPMHMLDDPSSRDENDDAWIEDQMQLLETTLQHFHVKAKVVNAMKGPAVTRFEVQPEPGVKVSKITNLSDDIKLSLAAKDIRMEAPIPGKNAIGIEVPNQQAQAVSLQEILESPSFSENDSPLSVGLGLDIAGSPVITDLKKMPHGLIAGATGSGKSVCINTILISLLYKAHYEDVKFLLIDPKMVELAPYNDLPHLVAPVITDVKAATSALKWAVKEMEERYEKFVAEGVRDIDRYNEKMKAKGRTAEKMPYMVIVIDELADLMMVSPQDVEDAICRIAQKARACGMHLLLATQRPSVDVITGLIKANIPTRVAFSVSSQVDSRTIIDTNGAEKLLGKGDMLFLENGSGKGQRIQGAFVSDDEIERIANYVKKIAPPQYMFEQEELLKQTHFEEEEDELFEEAVDFVINQNGASASLLQRRFKVGYNRAARLIDTMEEKGIISGAKGSKPREVYMTHASFEEYLAREKE